MAILRFGSPSWTHIEPCVSLHSRSFGSYSSKRETYQLRNRTEGRLPFLKYVSSYVSCAEAGEMSRAVNWMRAKKRSPPTQMGYATSWSPKCCGGSRTARRNWPTGI